jgi:polyhydroxyalkanoate synthesis regulator phasin
MKNAFRKYISESTNFMNDALKKQTDKVITELKAKSDLSNKELKENLKMILEEQKKSQELSSKTLTTIIDLVNEEAPHKLIEAITKARELNLMNQLKTNEG